MEKNYFFQEKTSLEPKRKTINFILNYSKSIKIQKTALEVISGCEGSAQRFIQVFQTLDKAGFVRKNALSTAINYAKKSDAQARMFCMVFQKAYLKKYLDLTAADAFKLAEELSNGSKDDKAPSASDFEKTVGFCIDDRRISLPRKFFPLAVRKEKKLFM